MKLYTGVLIIIIYVSFLSVFAVQAHAKNTAKALLDEKHSEIRELKDTKNFLTYCINGVESGALLKVGTGSSPQGFMFVSKPMVTQSLALAVNFGKMHREDAAKMLEQYTDDSTKTLPGLKKMLNDLDVEMRIKRDEIYVLRSKQPQQSAAGRSETKVPRAVIRPKTVHKPSGSRLTRTSGTRTPPAHNTSAGTDVYGNEIDAGSVSRKDAKTPGASSKRKSLDIPDPSYPGIPSDFITRSGSQSYNSQSGTLSEYDILDPKNVRATNRGYAKVEISKSTVSGAGIKPPQYKDPAERPRTKALPPSRERNRAPDTTTITTGFASLDHDPNPKPNPYETKPLPRDMLGKVWTETQSGFPGTWIRNGTSNEFYAVWELGSHRTEATLEVRGHGDGNITVSKKHGTDGVDCTYQGKFSKDGKKVSGTYTCPGEVYDEHWEAHIWN